MEKYLLQQDEVVIYEGDVSIPDSKGTNKVILTNYNMVIETTIRKLFKKPEIVVETYPVASIKTYNNSPQIKHKGSNVKIFFTNAEVDLNFQSMLAAQKFTNKAIELVSGQSLTSRGSDKVKNMIGLVDQTFGINTVETITSVMGNGVVKSVLGGTNKHGVGFGKKSTIQAVADAATEVIKTVSDQSASMSNSEPAKEANEAIEDKIEAVKKYKELLDIGAITQEEYDSKKKELLGL